MIQLCAPWIGQKNQLKAHSKSQLKRLVIQTADSGRAVVGPNKKTAPEKFGGAANAEVD